MVLTLVGVNRTQSIVTIFRGILKNVTHRTYTYNYIGKTLILKKTILRKYLTQLPKVIIGVIIYYLAPNLEAFPDCAIYS